MAYEWEFGMLTGALIGVAIIWLKGKMDIWSWPYLVPIINMKGGARQWVMTRAKRLIDKNNPNIQFFRLKNSKKNLPAPEYADVHIDSKGKNVLPLASYQEGQFFPLDVKESCPECKKDLEPSIYVEDKNIMMFGAVERERIKNNYNTESWLSRYANLIGILAVCGMVAFVVLFVFNALPGMLGQMTGAVQTFSDNLVKYEELRSCGDTIAPLGG